jgi:hypothetical protein
MKRIRAKLGLIIALTLGASAAVNADVLYNNIPDLDKVIGQDQFGDDITIRDEINENSSGKPLIFPNDYVASLFATPTCATNCSPLTLGNITLTMYGVDFTGSPLAAEEGAIKLQVYSNAATFLAGDDNSAADDITDTLGSPLTTLTLIGTHFSDLANNNVFTPVTPLALDYNTKYWVKLSATSSFTANENFAGWYDLSKNDIVNFLSPGQIVGQPPASFVLCPGCGEDVPDHGDFSTDPQLLMKVEATAATVPVPGAAWLMGSALLGLMRPWRRKGGH